MTVASIFTYQNMAVKDNIPVFVGMSHFLYASLHPFSGTNYLPFALEVNPIQVILQHIRTREAKWSFTQSLSMEFESDYGTLSDRSINQ